MDSIVYITELICRLREIESLLAIPASEMTPKIHGRASALVSIARGDAFALRGFVEAEMRSLERQLAEATNTEEAYYARRAKEMAE